MPFYSAAWKMDALQLEKEIMDPSIDLGFRTPMRIRMLSSLQRNYSLAEMNRREIIALLGHPDSTGSADMWGRDSLVAPGDSVMVYNLGEENIFSGFSGGGPGYWKEFQIEVGPDDKVRKVSLYDWGS